MTDKRFFITNKRSFVTDKRSKMMNKRLLMTDKGLSVVQKLIPLVGSRSQQSLTRVRGNQGSPTSRWTGTPTALLPKRLTGWWHWPAIMARIRYLKDSSRVRSPESGKGRAGAVRTSVTLMVQNMGNTCWVSGYTILVRLPSFQAARSGGLEAGGRRLQVPQQQFAEPHFD